MSMPTAKRTGDLLSVIIGCLLLSLVSPAAFAQYTDGMTRPLSGFSDVPQISNVNYIGGLLGHSVASSDDNTGAASRLSAADGYVSIYVNSQRVGLNEGDPLIIYSQKTTASGIFDFQMSMSYQSAV